MVEFGGLDRPLTLCIDVGGSGLKASVLDAQGKMVADRVRIPTPYPLPPDGDRGLVRTLVQLVRPLPRADRTSVGFPGMVRKGHVLSAPHFSTGHGPGSEVDPVLASQWAGYDLASALEAALGQPTRVANDADVQGSAVIAGTGLEFVITLGTGFGTAVFLDGHLLPHMELAHQPFRKNETYDQQLGDVTRRRIGKRRWVRRVRHAGETLDKLLFFDVLFVGGGNARHVQPDDLGSVAERTTIVNNSAGILGGVKLWEVEHVWFDDD